MVKYCIIVLTAGRKTAQPVVPARRVARIRAACTLLCRILDRPLRRIKYRVASRLANSSLLLSSSNGETGAAKSVVVQLPLRSTLLRDKKVTLLSSSVSNATTFNDPIRSTFHDTIRVSSPSLRCIPASVSRLPPLYQLENDYGATSRPSCVSRAIARPLFSGRAFARNGLQQQQQHPLEIRAHPPPPQRTNPPNPRPQPPPYPALSPPASRR